MKTIEYLAVKFLFFVFSRLSIKNGKRLALFITFLVEHLIRYRKKVILSNLHRVYGDKLPLPEKKFVHEIYKNFVFLWMEFLQSNHFNEQTVKQFINFKNPEILQHLKQREKGVILYSGHFGNFEWLGQAMALQRLPIWAIAKKQSNEKVDRFITKLRERFGARIVYTKQAMPVCQRALNNKELVAIAIDQDARQRGVFVNFLGLPSSTAVGTAVLHLRTNAEIILLIALRKDYAQFDVYAKLIEPPARTGDLEQDILNITQKISNELEVWVKKYPEQWFWMHRRWKTKPKKQTASVQNLN